MLIRRPFLPALLLATAALSACYPVELSTTRDGQIVVPRPEGVLLYNPATGSSRLVPPVGTGAADAVAVATPDGKWLVRAVRPYNGSDDPGNTTTLWLTSLVSENSRELASFENGTFLQVAPRDGRISWSFVSSEQYDGVTENMPELHVYEVQKNAGVRIATNVSVTHRWLPDGSGVVYLKTEGKDTDGRIGALCVWEIATGAERPIAKVSGAEWFDLSPDGREVILSAQGMAPLEGRRRSRGDQKALYVVNLADGAYRRLEFNAEHARYSPDGKLVALIKDHKLWITARDLELPENEIFSGVTSEIDNGTKIHLSWAGNTEVIVVTKRPRLGVVGMSPELVVVNAVTGASRNIQAEIDRLVRPAPAGNR